MFRSHHTTSYKVHRNREKNCVDYNQKHICCSFGYLRDWVTSRGQGNTNYVIRDQSIIDDRKHRDAIETYMNRPGAVDASGGGGS